MLQSLVTQSPINSNNNNNSSAMKTKRVDRETDITDVDDPSMKRANIEQTQSQTQQPHEQQEGASEAEQVVMELEGLLLQCAECVAMDNLDDATDLLPEISELSSPFGSSPERVGAYFGHALQARVVSSCLGTYSPLTTKSLTLSQSQKIFNALQSYNSICPLIKFSHFTANQAIFQALAGADYVHIIDLDIMQGLQWPGLFHILASRSKKIRSMRITGFGSSSELLESTGRRLADFANSLGLPFEFHPLEGKIGNVSDLSQLGVRPSEAIVVHWMHHCLYDITGSDLGTLRLLTLLRPKLITIVEQDLSHRGSFLGRFVEALHYYSALFDALGGWIGCGQCREAHGGAAVVWL
ncbi:hypothetical protein Patl1_33232 [Pistacia atlantica]|uniref:Uncharacterized protein n=1 Tax=Pistacia atlantica TaxID=434234 RepID=A0ACC1ANR5_9ROSI|nr:hypothetical protein Patl1_33232 [Pistacia atlantica]